MSPEAFLCASVLTVEASVPVTFKVTVPDVPPPVKKVPGVTPSIVPVLSV